MKARWFAGLFAAVAAVASAQSAPSAAGRWEGALKAPGQDVAIQVDLTRDAEGKWIGSLSTPQQGGPALPLSGISVQGQVVHFAASDLPASPVFDAKLNPQGTEMSGTCGSGGRSIMFSLKRTGEPQVSLPPPSSQSVAEFVGTWEGVIEGSGSSLRLILRLSKKADGSAAGSLVSLDQGNAEIGLNTIMERGKDLEFEIRAISGSYKGAMNAANSEITGTWTQMGNPVPLVFHRAPKR